MQAFRRLLAALVVILAAPLALMHVALAQMPHAWEIGMQTPHSPVKQDIADLNFYVTIIITLITALVAGLLCYVLFRFNAKRHPVPSRASHNTVLEITWTVVPVLILVIIAIPSFRLVYYEDRAQNPDMAIKVTGHQWYWEFTYPDQGNIDFTSSIIPTDQLKPGDIRLLSADNPLVLPVGKKIRVLTTSGDVIHSFFVPSLGVQRYAIPGRTIETWVEINQPGTYYGECNQICGTNHSQMPIEVRGVTEADFKTWVEQAKKKFSADAGSGAAAPQLASAASTQR